MPPCSPSALSLLRRTRISARRVEVIGSHGHTVYHGPGDRVPSTLQIGEPAVIAHRTGIPVVANFRPRDLAAGGEGAPLIPFFDESFFGRGAARAMQNIGGIANVTVVGRGLRTLAFDTGPGNVLIDLLARRVSRGRRRFDAHGRLAARGRIDHRAVTRLWTQPYFRKRPPKSTGPELFHDRLLRRVFGARLAAAPLDVLATVTYFTAYSIAHSYRRFVPACRAALEPTERGAGRPHRIREVVVSGGGVHNQTLMRHLAELLAPVPVRSIEQYGIPAQAKEPAAFAFLAWRAFHGRVNHLPETTGASTPCILGTLTPAR